MSFSPLDAGLGVKDKKVWTVTEEDQGSNRKILATGKGSRGTVCTGSTAPTGASMMHLLETTGVLILPFLFNNLEYQTVNRATAYAQATKQATEF